MGINLIDRIAAADFSAETDFKNILRKRLFESGAQKSAETKSDHKAGIFQFQRLGDDMLDMVSAAGDADLLRKQEALRKNGQDK